MRFRPLIRPLKAPRRARVLAALALMVLLLTLATVTVGIISLEGAIVALGLASLCAVLALVLAVYSIWRIWQETGIGTFDATMSALWAIPVLVCAGLLSYIVTQTPSYPDLATDVNNPPQFVALGRDGDALPLDVASPSQRIRLSLDHPDITSVYIPRPGWHVAEVVTDLLITRNWQRARYESQEGQAFVLEFLVPGRLPLVQHAIVLRLVDDGEGTLIDARSLSRMPLHDFGTNAPVLSEILSVVTLAIEATQPPTSDL